MPKLVKQVDGLRDYYRRCFGTEAGKVVLANLLTNLGYFDKHQKELVLQNFAVELLEKLGVVDEITSDGQQFRKVKQLVEKMFEIQQEE